MVRHPSTTALAMIVFSLPIAAEEMKIQQRQIPPPVQKTVREQSRGAIIKSYSTEMEHGKKVYEAETIVNGHTGVPDLLYRLDC